MAITYYYPNGNDGGWVVSTNTNCDDGFNPGNGLDNDVTGPNDATFITCDDQAADVLNLDTGVGSGEHAIVDGDTITQVQIKVRATLNASDPDSNLAVDLIIGGAAQGVQQETGHLTGSFVTYTLGHTGWNSDWTAAQIAGMQVRLTSEQGGMPAAYDVDVSEVEVIITYTEASSNHVIDGSQTPDLDPDPLITTGNTPVAVRGTVITPATGSLTFDGTGVNGGPYSSGIDHMGSGWGIGLNFIGQPLTIDKTEGGGNIVIDGSQTPDLDPDPLVFTGATPSAEIDHFRDVGLDTLQFTGTTPTLDYTWVAFPDKDDLQFTGYAPTLSYEWVVFPDKDDLQFTGTTPTVDIDHYRDVGTDTLLLTGTTPTLDYTWVTFPDKDDLVFTGAEPTLKVGITREPTTGTLEFTEATPSAEIDHYRDVGLDTLQFTGTTPLVFTGILRQPDTGTLEFTEATPSAEIDHYRDVGTDALQFNSDAPSIFVGILRQPDSGSLEFTESTPSAEIDHFRDVGTDALQFNSDAPTVFTGILRQPGTGSLEFTEDTPSAEIDHFRDVGLGTLEFTGYAPSLGNDYIITPATGSLEFTGTTPTLGYSWVVSPATGSLEFTGTTSTVTSEISIQPATGSLTFDGYGATGGPIVTGEHPKHSGWGIGLAFAGKTPNVSVNIQIPVFPGSQLLPDALEFSGKIPSAEIDHIRDVGTGSLEFTGSTPDPLESGNPEANTGTGSLTFTGTTPTLDYTWVVFPDTGSLTLTGNAPSLGSKTIPVGTGSMAFTGIAPARVDVAHSGVSITNPDATTAIPSNYEQCDYTGFRQMPGSLKLTWNKHAVRRKSWESRHPQDVLRNVPERKKGSRRPEQADRFIEDIGTVDPEDL